MTKKKLQLLFDLAEELYWEELKKAGVSTMPYVWAKHGEKYLAISIFGKHSELVEAKLKEII